MEHKSENNERNEFDNSDDLILKISVAAIITLITLLVYLFWQSRKFARDSILVVGLCDSGKTLLFSRLLHNKQVTTHTSMKENFGPYVNQNKSLNIVDIPGYERLRMSIFDKYKNMSRGIIYVIDSSTVVKDMRDVAECFYNILTDPTVSKISPQILILCNKQDILTSKSNSVVQGLLEKELSLLQVTKASQLESTEGNIKRLPLEGDNDFKFSSLHPWKIQFGDSICTENDSTPVDISVVKEWLLKV